METPVVPPPWEGLAVYPVRPEGIEYGLVEGRRARGCSPEELLERCRRGDPSLVWTPEWPTLVPPDEVPFLRGARRARLARQWAGFAAVAGGLLVLLASGGAGPMLPALLVIVLAGWAADLFRSHRRLSRSEADYAGAVSAARFGAWLGLQSPAVTLCLGAVIVLLFVAQVAGAGGGALAAGLVKGAVRGGEVWRLLSVAFVHGGPIHLFF
ncbi:MAG: hypothetical protein HY317_03430 [Acidobacteria bacterium]|nr:hypothetical protein [Acidobacteriota bacterium]